MPSNDVLMPCPFCGKAPGVYPVQFGGAPFWVIRCCIVDTQRRRSEADAVALWNNRAPSADGVPEVPRG